MLESLDFESVENGREVLRVELNINNGSDNCLYLSNRLGGGGSVVSSCLSDNDEVSVAKDALATAGGEGRGRNFFSLE